MRMRTIFLILAIVLVAGFTALNVDEFTRSSVLSLGFTTIQVPLGLVMLALLVATMLVFLATTVYIQSVHLIESRNNARELNTQRQLADKAEASRFTDLRTYMEIQAAASQQREAVTAKASEEHLAQALSALLARLDVSDNTIAAYMGHLDDRLERSSGLMRVRSSA